MSLSLLPLILLACNKGEELVLGDENNFYFVSNLAAEAQIVPAQEDSLVDWSGLTQDILENAIDPAADVTEVRVVRFGDLSQEEVIDGINNETLKQSDLDGFAGYAPGSGETSAMLSQFDTSGTYIDPAKDIVEDGGSYLVSAVSGTTYLMFTFFQPVTGAEPNTIELTGESAALTYEVDLDAGSPLSAGEGTNILITWSQLTTNGSENPIVLQNIDTLMLARYEEDLSELEADFLNLEEMADELYTADVSGYGSYDLSELESQGFAGLTGSGTWLLALRCSSCINPSPLFLGLFE